jgi:undecaprenyl-diphosphatase
MDIFQTIVIAIVEGITEYLPVSSTGHMIIAEDLLKIPNNDFLKLFTYSIQLGAILSVVVLYYKKFFDFTKWEFYLKLLVGVIPAIVLGKLFDDKIDALLDSRMTVAISLLLGGIILLFIDRAFNRPQAGREEQVSYKNSFMIGLWQCLAMIPGISRSAASIIGGMQQKLSRHEAAEFSFFLAVPTMMAATGYALVLKNWNLDANGTPIEENAIRGYDILLSSPEHITAFIIGNIVAFVVAMLVVKFFISFLKKHGFKIWGVYRICLGLLLFILMYIGVIKP